MDKIRYKKLLRHLLSYAKEHNYLVLHLIDKKDIFKHFDTAVLEGMHKTEALGGCKIWDKVVYYATPPFHTLDTIWTIAHEIGHLISQPNLTALEFHTQSPDTIIYYERLAWAHAAKILAPMSLRNEEQNSFEFTYEDSIKTYYQWANDLARLY